VSAVWLVSGAGSGVGRSLAVALASTGAEVILASRSRERLEDTARWCWAPTLVAPVDLADPASVDALAATVVGHLAGRPLAGIVHAAGLMAWHSPSTPSGTSLIPQVNALSPWRLTLALESALLAAPGARVLFVAGAPFTLRGVQPHPERWSGEQRGRGLALALEAAAAKVVMARWLHRRWAGVASAFAFHPGYVKSRLGDGLPFPLSFAACVAQPFLAGRSVTGEFLALDPAAPALSGHLVAGRRAAASVPFPADLAAEDAFIASLR
jgi:NAD(P)-dependent dehydrogenase (short-subunit alcohol dehydrogenase family)